MTLPAPRVVAAAIRGGCGKTTIALGLIAAGKRLGQSMIPFKKGPDYIDAGWLGQAAGRECYNLDPFLMTREQIVKSFSYRAREGGLAVIEGNRGLFDGTDESGAYSTAELAKLLQAPVLLILDCTKVTRTLAAIVQGCRVFDPELNLAGVVLNQVATSRQETLVRNVIEREGGVKVLGAVPRVKAHDLPERHLGLVPYQEHPRVKASLDFLADLAQKHIDLDRVWETARSAPPLPESPASAWVEPFPAARPRVDIGIIRDSAFQFYYPENLEALERLGARLKIFSSLDARRLPEVDALYLGGGFPETHAESLANNEGLRSDILRASRAGLPIYAECGGLMFLGRSLVLKDSSFPMAGVFPVDFCLEKKPQGHGYTIVSPDRDNPFYKPGEKLVGHEFHYSRPQPYDPDQVNLIFQVERGQGFDQGRDGLVSRNTLGTYTHLHALGTTRWAEALVDLALGFRNHWPRARQESN
ncbi:MAG: cobyrinate a,c-diamide synthase [Pseudomonadota bacterium]